MQSTLEKLIEEEREQIVVLDSKLDTGRTPYMKWQLQLAQHFLEDAKSALRDVKSDTSNPHWVAFATDCLQRASEKRKSVEETVSKYGGPANVVEVSG
ncbi:MAG: hypothetical protein ACLP7O_06070 [Terracidiphilus sp.]